MEKNSKSYIKISGTVEDVVFRNEETGFSVINIAYGMELISVVGEMGAVEPGEEIEATGEFVTHPSFGAQFRAQAVQHRLPATAGAIEKYLASGAIKGIGPILAHRLVEKFGDKTLIIFEKEPQRLCEVSGVSPRKAKEFAAQFSKIFGLHTAMTFLAKYGLAPIQCIRAWKLWGEQLLKLVEANPYLLCTPEIGAPFEHIDALFLTETEDPLASCRLEAGVIRVLQHNLDNGHTCLPDHKLAEKAALLLDASSQEILDCIEAMVQRGALEKYLKFCYLPALYEAESYCAAKLALMLQNTLGCDPVDDAQIEVIEAENGIRYEAKQRTAIKMAGANSVMILTGGPGTGKTTTLKGIIDLFQQRDMRICIAAPTGRAAKRISELTGFEAKTIHRLLEVDFTDLDKSLAFRRHDQNPLDCDAVIVDEMSMVDIQLFSALLRAIPLDCKLVMVGDSDQLPCVGAGNVLRDLLSSSFLPTVSLTEIFRQAQQSLIVTNAHAIVNGNMPVLGDNSSDFFFIRSNHPVRSEQQVVSLSVERLPKYGNFDRLWDIQVLCPSRLGPLGTMNLNTVLQNALNPPNENKHEVRYNGVIFREGDKVMQVRNNYDLDYQRGEEHGSGIFNGDIGVIEAIAPRGGEMTIRFDDRIAKYPIDLAYELELAYAITIHKSQGSEYEAVIIPLNERGGKLSYRNLLYTGITRAKKMVVLIGTEQAVQAMVDNDRRTLRYSNLIPFLQEAIS